MQAHPKLLDKPEEIVSLARQIETAEMLALDTEFLRESTFFPNVALIQVADTETSWLIDPLALSPEELKPLLDVFTNPKILKILHAAQADQECLYTAYGITARPTLDTAAAASLCGYGDSIGLAKLLKDALGINLKKGHARTDWTVRPIQSELLSYAHYDVQYLLPLARKLLSELDAKQRRAWALELSAKWENERLYQPNHEGIAQKLAKSGRLDRKGYAALRELVAWREMRARTVNVPRRRIADDDVLVDLARVRPRDLTHLKAFRGLNQGEFRHSGEAILAGIRKAMQTPENELLEVPSPEIPDAHESRAVEFLQCVLKILADDLDIVSRHLLSGDDLLKVVRRKDLNSAEDLVRSGTMSEGAARLIGDEIVAAARGRISLVLNDGHVRLKREPAKTDR